jgi:hypothetical protein
MGLRSWVREHRDREREMRQQGFLLMDRIMGHLAVPLTAGQEAEYDRLHAGAIRAGQARRDEWMDFGALERERRAQGWTGQNAEIPPLHFADLAAAREELWQAEAAERGTPAWQHRAHERATDRVARGTEALERAERVLGMRGWTDESEHRLRVGEIGPTHLPPARTPEEAEEQAFQGLFHGAVRAGQILYGEKTYRELTDMDALEAMARDRRMAGWTGDQAEVAPPRLDEAAAAREDLWSAMHAAQRAAERGVLRTGVAAHREAVDGVLRAVEAVERAEGRGVHEDNAPPASAREQERGMPASTPPLELELEKTQALTPEAAEEMRQAVEEVPDPLENLPRDEEEEFERLLETYQLAAGALERRPAGQPLPSMLSPEAVHTLANEERAGRVEELEHWLMEAESAQGTDFQQFDDESLEEARAELHALYQRMNDDEPGLDEASYEHDSQPDLVSSRPDAQRSLEYTQPAEPDNRGLDDAESRLQALTQQSERDPGSGIITSPEEINEELQQALSHGYDVQRLDEELAAEAHAPGADQPLVELEQLDRDPTAAADTELFAGYPSPDGAAAATQIVDELETDLDRDGADTAAELEDGVVHRDGGGEPVDALEDEPSPAGDPSDQHSAEHDDIEREDESGVDSQADRLARTRLEAESEPEYASHTELDHAHEAEMDW